jgi:dihydromethanopterin reductase (acceptor)
MRQHGKDQDTSLGVGSHGIGTFLQRVPAHGRELDEVDLFVSRAATELVRMHRQEFKLPKAARVFRDTTASAALVELFFLAPATLNTVAKCVVADTLVTIVFAQARKCRLPAMVFACDTAPELETEAPKGMVKVYPREIDLKNTERLKSFESTVVVESLEVLRTALGRRRRELND